MKRTRKIGKTYSFEPSEVKMDKRLWFIPVLKIKIIYTERIIEAFTYLHVRSHRRLDENIYPRLERSRKIGASL